MRSSFTVLLWATLLSVACGPRNGPDFVVRSDSAGIEVVLSGGVDRPLGWQIDSLFSLGGEEDGPETFFALTAAYVASDALGRIYVLDYGARRVVVFSKDGDFIRQLGREGRGPGELSGPSSISVSRSGEVAVFDYGKMALVRFAADGTPVPEVPFGLRPRPTPQRHTAFFDGGLWVSSDAGASSDEEMAVGLYAIQDEDTTLVVSASFPAPVGGRYESCGIGLRIPRLFDLELPWAATRSQMVVAPGPRYELELYSGTRLVRRFGRDVPVREATRELAIEELGDGFTIRVGGGPCTIAAEEMVAKRGFAPLVPWIQLVTLSPGGDTWVRRRRVGPDPAGPVDVFDASGAYVGSLPEGSPVPLVFLDDTRFAAAVTDELGVTRLVVYRLTRA